MTGPKAPQNSTVNMKKFLLWSAIIFVLSQIVIYVDKHSANQAYQNAEPENKSLDEPIEVQPKKSSEHSARKIAKNFDKASEDGAKKGGWWMAGAYGGCNNIGFTPQVYLQSFPQCKASGSKPKQVLIGCRATDGTDRTFWAIHSETKILCEQSIAKARELNLAHIPENSF